MVREGSSGDFVPAPLAVWEGEGGRGVLPWIMDSAYPNSASRYVNSSWPLLTVPYLPETLIWLSAISVAVKACQTAILWTNCTLANNKLDISFPNYLPWVHFFKKVIFIVPLLWRISCRETSVKKPKKASGLVMWTRPVKLVSNITSESTHIQFSPVSPYILLRPDQTLLIWHRHAHAYT